ncbi:MAG: putative membrane protein [uncultured Rubrobacteraceae bacterium]|uniref:Probable membrane transporter protein n=1 Tax=uncultured Rubrobacteraceae bacterium TaxID=349277 RepID=A0A6J4QZI3_9ACTN|nr:MAG: putative membrane protein [uncultured Rubrobacteraceae bacterium]
MYFPVSGIEANPLLLLLAAFCISLLTTPAGVSGAFLLLPFQVSVLGFTSPAVSPTNLIYNVVATPGGIYRYVREGRVVWPLAWTVVLGTLPGVFIGAVLRVTYFSDPRAFKVFVGFVLLYLGARLLYEALRRLHAATPHPPAEASSGEGILRAEGVVRTTSVSARGVEYEYAGRRFSFGTVPVLLLSFVVGIIGGIYSIGGGSIIAPFFVLIFGLPVYTVAGAALISTFLTSVAGVVFFQVLDATGVGGNAAVAPDWLLGVVLGVGGLAGTYAGARVQKFLPEMWIRTVLGTLVVLLALSYISQLFTD